MATQGPNITGTAADDSGVGTRTWANPTRIQTADGDYSDVVGSGAGATTSHYLKAQNFGFTIPSGATINGIMATIYRQKSGTPQVADTTVKLITSGNAVSGTNKNNGTVWITSLLSVDYGSSSDLWGLSWSYSDINSSNFGVVLSVTLNKAGKGYGHAYVQYIKITITYTAGASSDLKSVSGVVSAGLSKAGGTAKASISKIAGQTV